MALPWGDTTVQPQPYLEQDVGKFTKPWKPSRIE